MNEAYRAFGIDDRVIGFVEEEISALRARFDEADATAEHNQARVVRAMQKNRVSAACFAGSSGYGYNDRGRELLERIYADIFETEDALVRAQFTSGTHALYTALAACLLPGDELLSPCGRPYDTLEEVIGLRPSPCSLKESGVSYRQVDLTEDGEPDWANIRAAIGRNTKLVYIQRSKGYEMRPSLSVARISELISFVKGIKPDVICLVDNCYGEFVERREPTACGADLAAGSLIKNPGGGLAPSGGYVCGRRDLIERCACRLCAPGLGAEVGASLGVMTQLYQGLFLAPTVTAAAVKGACLAAAVYERLGFHVSPGRDGERTDIIQSVELGSPEAMVAFCQGVQAAAPVDSFVRPIPYAMPGYESDVVMAAGSFVQGSSIELSADGPIRPPYAVYFQGGLTFPHAKLGVLMTLQRLLEANIITI